MRTVGVSEASAALPAYLLHNIEFIWSVVEQGVEGVALCQRQKGKSDLIPTPPKSRLLRGLIHPDHVPCLPDRALREGKETKGHVKKETTASRFVTV